MVWPITKRCPAFRSPHLTDAAGARQRMAALTQSRRITSGLSANLTLGLLHVCPSYTHEGPRFRTGTHGSFVVRSIVRIPLVVCHERLSFPWNHLAAVAVSQAYTLGEGPMRFTKNPGRLAGLLYVLGSI